MKEGLISIIIPMYNEEKNISNCIESIINQTYNNIEIILVNDGSTDNTKQICEKYSKKDKRIILINKINEGVSIARNIGIQKANGEYITFIDSDDTLELDAYETCIKEMKKENADIVCFNYRRMNIETNFKKRYGIKEKKEYIFPEILEDYLSNDQYNKIGEANWNKIFKYEIIKNIEFRKIKIGEDFIFNYEAFKNAKKIINIPEILYNYTINSNSVTSESFNKEKLLEYIYSRKEILKDIKENYKQYYNNAFVALCDTYYYSIEKIAYETNLKREKDFLEVIEEYKKLKQKEEYKKLYEGSIRNQKINYIIENYKKIIRKNKIKAPIKRILPKSLKKYVKRVRSTKKVAILTINDNNNYGNRLQNYATQQFIKKHGLIAETIYNTVETPNFNITKFKIKNKIKATLFSNINKYRKSARFSSFNNKINFSKYTINKNNIPDKIAEKYELFFTGSDQVWNPSYNRTSEIDFLAFVPKEKRNSLSASFGISQIPEEKKEKYKKYLEEINNISVREEKGKEIIKELTKRDDIEVLLDPTMLISSEEWDKVSKKPKGLKKEKYILNYFLGELSEKRKVEIEKIANENNCKIVNLLDKNDKFYNSGPEEFVYLEKNAFLICTDSFHSSVFAILYNRPFIVFDREDKEQNMNSRLETLLNKFGLQDRKFNDTIKKDQLKCDYTNTYKILKEEQKKADKFLDNIL